MENSVLRFIFLLLVGCIILSISSQIYSSVNEKYTIETAVIHSSADRISFKGVYIRNEAVIKRNYSGVLSYTVEDGSKVANGSVIAYVYRNASDIETNRHIREIADEIELLNSAQNPGTVLTAKPDFISSLIGEQYQAITTRIAKKDISDIKSHRDSLLTLMSIYRISVNQEENYDSRIAELNLKMDELTASRQSYTSAITSPDSGYFVSYTDGYENILRLDDNSTVTPETIKDIIANEKNVRASRSKSEIGKLVYGYDWKIAGIIDNSDSVYNPGDAVKLSFASTPDTVNAVIEFLEPTDNPDEWLMILKCDELTFDLAQKRVERVEMTLNDFEGIKVPKEALRFNKNNEKGCYVLWGQRVLFKKVEPIFESESYILSKIISDEEYICVYDDIIIEGVDTESFMANSNEIADSEEEENSEEIQIYSQAAVSEEETSETEGTSETEETAALEDTGTQTEAEETEASETSAPDPEGDVGFE